MLSSLSSLNVSFVDPEPYQRAIRAAEVDIVVTGKGRFQSELTRIDLPCLWMQRAYENLPRVVSVTMSRSRVPIVFLTSANQASVSNCGMEVSPGSIIAFGSGSSYSEKTSGPIGWAAMSLATDDFTNASHSILGRQLFAPTITHQVRPAPALMSRLSDLHESVGLLAKGSPDLLTQPEVAAALEQALIHVMVRCLGDGTPVERSTSNYRHAAIVSRLEDLLLSNFDRPLHLAQVCAAVGVAERTLRVCCQEHLGMGPVRWLWLRRMHLAHGALINAVATTTTVTEIATAHGFWELGRFAVAYRQLFGESPVVSLNRPPPDRRKPRDNPFSLAV